MKKILSFLFVLFITLQLIVPFSIKAEGDDPEDDGTINIVDSFFVTTVGENRTLAIPFNIKWFNNKATEYNHDLAKMSLGLATAAFRPSKTVEYDRDPDYNLRFFLYQAGFEDMRSDDYNKDPSMYTVSTMMGHQKVGEGDDAYELIAVGICGQGYLDEWESNFSIGLDTHPEGFGSAAQLVYDRVFGYIAANHLSGKLKIWVSGFSRAAAISNIAAARLSDSDLFGQENVFAYTFATPNTVKADEIPEYKNIFNICGKMDPVTTMPFTAWGYKRYGTTFYTPSLETDSDFQEKRKIADKLYNDLTGISYWNNADIHSELRLILDCMLRICPTVENYVIGLQSNLISLWEKHDFISVLKKLMEMSEDPFLINDENRADVNLLLNRISALVFDYVTSGNAFRRYNQKASVGSNILQTHTPELYMSWVLSFDTGEELYSDALKYAQVYVDGDVTVRLYRKDVLLDSLSSDDYNYSLDHRYLSIHDNQVTALVPRDHDYIISIVTTDNDDVSALVADYTVGKPAPSATQTSHYTLKKGETVDIELKTGGSIRYVDQPDSVEMKVFNPTSYLSNSNFANFIFKRSYDLSWKDMIMLMAIVVAVGSSTIFFLVTLLVKYLRHVHRRKKGLIPKDMKFRPLPIFNFFLISQLIIIKELERVLYDMPKTSMAKYKLIIGILILIIAFYGYRRKKDRFHLLIMLSVIMLTAADIAITFSVTWGAILFILSYLLLTYNYIKEDTPDNLQNLAWVLLSTLGTFLVMSAPGTFGHLRVLAVLYVIASSALVCSSYVFPGRTFRGSALLLISGIFVIIGKVFGDLFIPHILGVITYYMAVITLASSGSGYVKQKHVQETLIQSEEEIIE